MQETFDKLKGLQDILSRKIEIEREMRDIPKTLSTKTELVNRLKKTYIEKNAQYEQIKERIADLREKMLEAEDLREKYEGQMDAIRTQREYEALDKEIRDASEKEMQFRKDLQREERLLEEMKYALEREEAMIKSQEDDLNREMESVRSESEKKQIQLKDLEKEELAIVPGLSQEMLFKFERIIRSKAGLGIVALRRGVCMGCHMILPMQFVNDVRRGDDILFCPYCSRILFFQEDDEGGSVIHDAEGLSDLVDFDLEDDEVYDEEDLLDDEDGDDDEGNDREGLEEEDV